MKNLVWLLKLLTITLSFLFFLNFLAVEPVYSRGGGGGGGGGCFGDETLILTPDGSQTIKQLHPGDRVINYNFSTHDREEGTVGDIEIISSPDYYLINHQTKVTGTHPFYVQTEKGIKLTEVQNLQKGARVINSENSLTTISSIEYISQPISVYNLISIHPNNNFYADGFLVHNKGGGSLAGGAGGGTGGGKGVTINAKTLPALLKALVILVAGLLPFAYWRQIYNLILYSGQKFTDEPQLIELATKINANFQNKYSVWYLKDQQIWQESAPQSELPEAEYQHRLSKAELVAGVSNLFLRYQHDWTVKNLAAMSEYIREPLASRQKQIFQKSFGNNFDIIYACKLSQIIPLEWEAEEEQYIFRVQINAEMINFQVSGEGYILSGEPEPRCFSEYWQIGLDGENNWYLIKISQVGLFGVTIPLAVL